MTISMRDNVRPNIDPRFHLGRLRYLTIGALFAVGIASCGVGDADDAGEQGEGGVVTLTYSNHKFSEPGRGEELIRVLLDQFNETHDDVEVLAVNIPFPRYADTISTQVAGGGGPDIINTTEPLFHQLVRGELVADVGSYLSEAGSTYQFTQSAEVAVVDGTRYGLPFEATNYALIVNSDILQSHGLSAPRSFEDFLDVARATTGEGRYGLALRHTMAERAGWWVDLSTWVYGFGGSWTDENGNPTVDKPEVAEAVDAYKRVYDEELIPIGADAATYRRMAWEGQVAMMIDNHAVPSILANENPKMRDATEVYPAPFPTSTHLQNVNFTIINGNSDAPNWAVKEFLEHMLSEDVQRDLRIVLGGSEVALDIELPGEVTKEFPWMETYSALDDPKSQIPTGMEDVAEEVTTTVLEAVESVLVDDVPVREALGQAQEKLEALQE